MIRWLKCRDATRLASQAIDRRLSLAERISLRVHLAICEGCTNFRDQIEFLREAVRRLGTREDA